MRIHLITVGPKDEAHLQEHISPGFRAARHRAGQPLQSTADARLRGRYRLAMVMGDARTNQGSGQMDHRTRGRSEPGQEDLSLPARRCVEFGRFPEAIPDGCDLLSLRLKAGR